MARALGATASQLEELFERSDYDAMFSHLAHVGRSSVPGIPSTAELGITADPTLTQEAKTKALDYLRMLRASEEAIR
jgi:hypothetical protein